MTLNDCTNFTVSEHKSGDKGLYILIAKPGYCFRNNAEPFIDEEGNTYFDHAGAIMVLDHEIDKLADYDCVELVEGMVIH